MDFVTVADGRLMADGEPFRFMGTNCYFLQEEGAREALGWEGYAGRVDEALRKVAALGLGVVRAWAFNDDPSNPAAIQKAPFVFGEAGLRGMDLAIVSAAAHGVRLLLSLGNYWSDYGGIEQYLRWHGLDPEEPSSFFTNAAVVEHYGGYIEHLLGRVNHLTGVRWGDDPTILGWELLNEPRFDADDEALCEWVETTAARVRRSARQLVTTGEEGVDSNGGRTSAETGRAFRCNTSKVDFASVHLYPESWGWESAGVAEAGIRWIEERASVAAELERPLVLGEFGLRNRGGLTLEHRRTVYETWMNAAIAHPSVAGALSWSFSTDDRPDSWDEHTWYWRDGTDPTDEANRYADLHREWARRFC